NTSCLPWRTTHSIPQLPHCCTSRAKVYLLVPYSGEALVREAVSVGVRVASVDERAQSGCKDRFWASRTPSMDTSLVESRGREHLDARLHRHRPRSRCRRNRAISHSGMENIFVE